MFEINKKCSKLTFFCEKLTFFRTRFTRSKQAPIHSPYKRTRGDAEKVESHRARNIHTADAVNSRRKEKKNGRKRVKSNDFIGNER